MQWFDGATDTRPSYSTPAVVNSTSNAKPQSTATVDNSLTSLNWLPQFKIPIDGKADSACTDGSAATIPHSTSSVTNSDSASSTESATQESEVERDECFLPLSPIKRCVNQSAEFERNPLRYEEYPGKPPFSYTTIIYLAIRSCNKEKVMLGDIYQWIKDHFMYYRIAESTWQNSVRHNLSLNQFFHKIPRGENDPGKGSFWQINPEYDHLLSNDQELQRLLKQQNSTKNPLQRKRSKSRKKATHSDNSNTNNNNGSTRQNNSKKNTKEKRPSNTKPLSSPPTTSTTTDPCHLPCDMDWVSLLSSQRLGGCISCSDAHYRPTFGSPIMGTSSDLVDSVSCSPAVLPMTLHNRILDTPPQRATVLCSSLEEIITTQESPAPLLPPWAAETRSYSPTPNTFDHPWAETHDVSSSTRVKHWSPPEVMWNTNNPSPQIDCQNKLQIAQLI